MMKASVLKHPILLILLVPILVSFGLVIAGSAFSIRRAESRVIEVVAYQFGWSPESIRITAGETIIFRVTSRDVDHGFYIDGFSVKEDLPLGSTVDIGPLIFSTPGKYKLRCATTCGPLHPFMVADIIVEPDYTFPVLSATMVAVALGVVLYSHREQPSSGKLLGVSLEKEVDLLKLKGVGNLLKRFIQWRGFHFFVVLPNLAIFILVINTGFFGNPTGNLNFSIAVVWILWFAAVEFMILFGSRLWCTICPLPAFGEWLSRRRLYSVNQTRKWFNLRKTWPNRLNNIWIASLSFLGISLIVPWLVTRPVVSGLLFVTIIITPFILHLIFHWRRFCLHMCPASAYIGYHSSTTLFAVRSRDKSTCDKHMAKECIRGSPTGYGCPWKLYPGGNDWSNYCGQCFECVRSCPLDNMTLKFRMIGKDIISRARTKFRTDEAWIGFIRFTLAIFYEMVFFGPYFWIKSWGNMGVNFGANLLTIGLLTPSTLGFVNWLQWVTIVLSVTLLIFPSVFFLFSLAARKAAGEKQIPRKQVFLAFSYALAPYGLLIWIAFALSLLLVNWAYPVNAFMDPFGLSWDPLNQLGLGKFTWSPIVPQWLPYFQAPVVFLGLAFAISVTYKISMNFFNDQKRALKSTSVMSVLHILSGLFFLWMLTG